jgi:hypothetical protein
LSTSFFSLIKGVGNMPVYSGKIIGAEETVVPKFPDSKYIIPRSNHDGPMDFMEVANRIEAHIARYLDEITDPDYDLVRALQQAVTLSRHWESI